MSLPLVTCPACSAQMGLDVLLGHQGARDALVAMANLHPAYARLQMTALRYCALFAPAKQVMRLDRVATLLGEIGEMVRSGRVEHRGSDWAAPLDYWISAMEDMLAKRDTLTLPLKSHGYLKTIVANYSERIDAAAERKAEDAKRGATPIGGLPPTPVAAAPPTPPKPQAPRRMPQNVAEALNQFRGRTKQPSGETE